MPRLLFVNLRAHVAYAHDIIMAAASFILSLFLRLGEDLVWFPMEQLAFGTVVFTAVAAAVFWSMRMYRGVWLYASLSDLLAITRAVSLVILIFLVLMFVATRLEDFPRSLPLINWFVLMALLGGPRFLYRLTKDRRFIWQLEHNGHRRVPVLLAGAGDGSELFIRATARAANGDYRAVGIVTERPDRLGQNIHGVEVMGTLDDIPRVVETLEGQGTRPQRLIITHDDMEGVQVQALLKVADELGMTLARTPRLTDFRSGLDDTIDVKPVAVEDLLGRPQATLDRDAMRAFIAGRRIMITGAGGSIGSELVRQIATYAPAHVTLLDMSEFNLYSIEMELADSHPEIPHQAMITDVRDRGRLEQGFAEARPDLVFHAAALKHVPLVEANPLEGIRTNVLGTVNVADMCRQSGVATMVQISTDKAVNPTSVMGATKRLAERYCQGLDLQEGGETRFVTVRFGNVLGSTGSVVPLFQKQLARGGPLTVTDPEMTRYFMTVREAVELVLQASALGGAATDGVAPSGMATGGMATGGMATGGKSAGGDGRIFVLDMGEPVRIIDLATQMIRLAGLRPGEDIAIEIIGPRPGEKLFEEVFLDGENLMPTDCKGLLLAAPRAAEESDLNRITIDLTAACAQADSNAAIGLVRDLVPEYQSAGDHTPRAASG